MGLLPVFSVLFYLGSLPSPSSSQAVRVGPKVATAVTVGCASQELRDTVRSELAADIRYQINNTILPSLCVVHRTPSSPAASCNGISMNCSSGYYWIRSSNGTAVQVYCDMDRVCGCNTSRGWTRVAHFNMSNATQQCPEAWREVTAPRRTCGRTNLTGPHGGGCSSAYFSTHGISYSRVCGRVKAYQYGHPDAFGPFINRFVPNSIDVNYVDGISITHGQPTRHHIWTFANAVAKVYIHLGESNCACTDPTRHWSYPTPSWVGNDYFCESGNPGPGYRAGILYPDDPLWDGQGCGATNTCCQFNNPPWFCKQLPQATTDNIEVRLCGNENTSSEDSPIELIEIYIQ